MAFGPEVVGRREDGDIFGPEIRVLSTHPPMMAPLCTSFAATHIDIALAFILSILITSSKATSASAACTLSCPSSYVDSYGSTSITIDLGRPSGTSCFYYISYETCIYSVNLFISYNSSSFDR